MPQFSPSSVWHVAFDLDLIWNCFPVSAANTVFPKVIVLRISVAPKANMMNDVFNIFHADVILLKCVTSKLFKRNYPNAPHAYNDHDDL